MVEILNNVKTCIDECISIAQRDHGIEVSQIKALGISNQRETTVVWDRETGNPLHNAIVWQDSRTRSVSAVLRSKYDNEHVRKTTGLPISTYFSAVKLRWLIDNVREVREGINNGTALFGTIDTWLIWNLTEGNKYLTDVTNAGRTMLMNIHSLSWDSEMLQMMGITRDILPEIRSCSEIFGVLSCTPLRGLPISGVIGDQQGALVGQSCFNVGDAKSTYGTGCFLIVNTGTKPKLSANGLLTTPAYKLGPDAPCYYSLEGSVAVAGSAVTWLRDSLRVISSSSDSEAVASSVDDTGEVYVVPAFTGLYAPWWREDARGTIVGLTQYTTRAHIVRATLESMAFRVDAVLKAASSDMNAPVSVIRVDGGVTENNLVMQMQADITGSVVDRPKVVETSCLGAAFLAGHAVGMFQSNDEFSDAWVLDRRFEPQIDEKTRQKKLYKWNMAVERSLGWASGETMDEDTDTVDIAIDESPKSTEADSIFSSHFFFGITIGVGVSYCAWLWMKHRSTSH